MIILTLDIYNAKDFNGKSICRMKKIFLETWIYRHVNTVS